MSGCASRTAAGEDGGGGGRFGAADEVAIAVVMLLETAAAVVGAAVGWAVPAGAVPSEGVAAQVALRDFAKLFSPSGWSGSEGPGGRVPT